MIIKVIYGKEFKVKYFTNLSDAQLFAKKVGSELIIAPKSTHTNNWLAKAERANLQ